MDAADVGDHLGAADEGERVVTHLFACTRRGYVGWRWSVTVTRASRQKAVTVDEVVLIPGDEAIVAPAWVPYRERIQPGDLSPGDLLPVSDEDPRLVPTYSFGDDPLDTDDKAQIREVAQDLGLGRVRTLSVEGRELAAQRWYDGDGGPDSPLAQSAPDHCTQLRLPGPHRRPAHRACSVSAPTATPTTTAGWSALDHGCGAHSEVRLAKKHEPQPMPDPVFDTLNLDEVETSSRPRAASAAATFGVALGAKLAPPAAVLQPEQPEPEAGQAGPQPPGAAVVLEPAVERQQGDEADQPGERADLDGAHAVHVERLDVGDDEGAVADLVLLRLVVAEVHSTG